MSATHGTEISALPQNFSVDTIILGMYNAAMTKTIPRKMTRLDGAIQRAQAEFMVASFDRMTQAKAVYDMQDAVTRDSIDRMQALLIRLARTRMWVVVGENKKGKKERVICDLPHDAIWNNALYMAVQMLKDLAYMDIRVANFNWPVDLCVECGTEIKPIRKKVRR